LKASTEGGGSREHIETTASGEAGALGELTKKGEGEEKRKKKMPGRHRLMIGGGVSALDCSVLKKGN